MAAWPKTTGEALFFALGCRYGELGRNSDVKEGIDRFLGDILEGTYISEFIIKYEYYGFKSQEEVFRKVDEIIGEVELLLDA